MWMGALSDRFGRKLQPETQAAYYVMLTPLLSTEEFERAAQQIFRDEKFWPEPKMFIELANPGRRGPQRYISAGVSGSQTFGGGCFEVDKHGVLVTHRVTCDCGREYQQFCLSIPWLEAISEGARKAMLREFPIGRCPTECPSCARKILATGISYPEKPREYQTPEWAA